MATQIKIPKKLIEVALPLDDINEAAGKEKSIRHGHPSTLHLWWARRPLAAARAVIFSQMVNDPGFERSLNRGMRKDLAKIERKRLFEIIRKLVQWDNTTNREVMAEAQAEIWRSWRETCDLNKGHPEAGTLFNPDQLPAFHDPFAGGGALPLEGQRLGLESFASDLNPVAVLINKASIEFPPKFAGLHPIGPRLANDRQTRIEPDWSGARGLAEDVRRYGSILRDRAIAKIGRFYPPIQLSKQSKGDTGTVIAWIWARTVKSPNPAFSHVYVPLASTFVLSDKAGREAWVEPLVRGDHYEFVVKKGKLPADAKKGTKLSRGANFQCVLSGSPIEPKYIKEEGAAGRMGSVMMAIVVETDRGNDFIAPDAEQIRLAALVQPEWKPEIKISGSSQYLGILPYGMTRFDQLYTNRQLLALATLCDLVAEIRDQVETDALRAGFSNEPTTLEAGGRGAAAYADAVATYLAFAIDKGADYWNTNTTWMPRGTVGHLFTMHAISMSWDYPEANPFSSIHCGFEEGLNWVAKAVERLPAVGIGSARQQDAQTQEMSTGKVISTDPPYFDNVPYADISDFFYVWMRRSLRSVFPALFGTIAVPKAEELVAARHRHGGRENAEKFFLDGMTHAMHRLSEQAHPSFPITIYYAFKQSDDTDVGTGNTGWETFLEAVIRSGLAISGTWPLRTEREVRSRGIGSNALASSIVLVCRTRDVSAPSVSRRDFLRELKEELGEAVDAMIGGAEGISPVAPVDLAQAVIGPGMAIFSKYSAVLEADGNPMTVHAALTLINRMLTEGVEDFDADTQFCLGWFDERGWSAGEFGQADVLARAKGTSVSGVKEAGVIEAGAGKVRLLKPTEYPSEWSPVDDNRTPVWEALHQMIRVLKSEGEGESGRLLAGMPQRAEPIRNLAYRLYTLCERKGWAEDARAYNELIASWSGIQAASHEAGHLGSQVNLDI